MTVELEKVANEIQTAAGRKGREMLLKISKALQSASANLEGVGDLYKSSIDYTSEIRTDEMFQQFTDEMKKMREEEFE